MKQDKFVLKIFNQLLYNWEVSEPLVTCFLLSLLNHYFPTMIMKTINIALLKIKFELILGS